jgi:membrane protease YdiL (CAAX protease family)
LRRPTLSEPSPPPSPLRSERSDRDRFLAIALVFEGSLVIVALVLGWIFRIDVLSGLKPSLAATWVGVGGAIPPFALLLISERFKFAPLERIKELLLETIGPSLAACRWYDVMLLAAFAGVGEEVLFRGLVQPLFERWTLGTGYGPAAGLILSNVIFGLLHFITPTYALLAGLMGTYFGWLLDATGSRNLAGPILAHGLYDYLAFLVVIRAVRQSARRKHEAEVMKKD